MTLGPVIIDWMGRPHTANDERRKHWRALAPIHRAWREAGAQAAMINKLPKLDGQVHVTAWARYAKQRTDPDGIAPTIKCVLDGLVDHGVLVDDGPDYVLSVCYLAPLLEPGLPDAVFIILEPVKP